MQTLLKARAILALANARPIFALVAVVIALTVAGSLQPSPASAQVDPRISIRSAVESWLQGRHKIDDIRPTPLRNMYEVRIGADLMYVDARGEFAFIEGQMIDLKANKNLTQARLDELQRIDFAKDLPFDIAIRQVNGNGKRVLAVFEDPNCTFCKKLRADLIKVKDLTLYTFAYAILGADSDVKARKAWCAEDRSAAWDKMLISSAVPANDGNCANPVARIRELGRQLNVTGTPTMFFANGKRVPGAIPVEQLEKLLAENG